MVIITANRLTDRDFVRLKLTQSISWIDDLNNGTYLLVKMRAWYPFASRGFSWSKYCELSTEVSGYEVLYATDMKFLWWRIYFGKFKLITEYYESSLTKVQFRTQLCDCVRNTSQTPLILCVHLPSCCDCRVTIGPTCTEWSRAYLEKLLVAQLVSLFDGS
jgi:hypothetical protein